MKKVLKNINIIDIPRFLSSWLISIFYTYKSINFNNYNIYSFIVVFFISFVVYTYFYKKLIKFHSDSVILFFNYLLCSLKWLINFQNIENNIGFLISILLFFVIIIIYVINKNNTKYKLIISKKIML